MKILLLEPYLTGSHKSWAEQYVRHSRHQIEILGLRGKYWKWRMHGGAVSLAREYAALDFRPDLVLASDMCDLSTFLGLTRLGSVTSAIYFHENQLTYPWSPDDSDPAARRDMHYAFINYVSALAADVVVFNSAYHRTSFLGELPRFLKTFPDCRELQDVELIAARSHVLHLGLDLQQLECPAPPKGERPLILWNHRWEYDKNPQEFFEVLFELADEGLDFEVAILGENYRRTPAIFEQARERLNVVHFGYAQDNYASWLRRADILPVTSVHDFFGISVVEAIHAGCYPLLPNRLAYPEHLPDHLHGEHLYESRYELVVKLRYVIRNFKRLPTQGLAEHVWRYDWSQMAAIYDEFWERRA